MSPKAPAAPEAAAIALAPPEQDDQAACLRALMERLTSPAPRDARSPSPLPLKPATLGGRLGADGWGRPDEALDRDTPQESPARTRSRVVALASGKGGVGKTHLTVSLAVAAAAAGLRVTLLDADFGLANADVVAGVTPRGRLDEVIDGKRHIQEILVEAPGGFRLVAGATGVSRLVDAGSHTARAVVARLERLERDADLVLIDCAAGIGRSVVAMLLAADMPVVVATPEPTSITDAYGLIKAARLEAQRAGRPFTPQLWINQARDEREAHRVYQRLAGVGERFLGAPIGLIGWTPIDPAVPDAVRRRTPVVLASPGKPAAQSVRRVCAEIIARLELGAGGDAPRPGFFQRLLGVMNAEKKREKR